MAEKKKYGSSKNIDREQFESLCGIWCTKEEIASIFGVSTDTLARWCEKTYKDSFATIYKNYCAEGNKCLRRYQLDLAKTSASMAIFLGKQYLGQRDSQDINLGGKESEIPVVNIILEDCNKDKKNVETS